MAMIPAPSGAGGTFIISPNTLYYITLYAVVIVVHLFKLRKEEAGKKWEKHNWKEIFHVGLEIVYTASGLVVLLIADLPEYIPFIVMAYVFLVFVSSQIQSMEERFSDNVVFGTHIFILIFVLAITFLYFDVIQRSAKSELLARSIGPHHYKVLMPYQDLALRDHIGVGFGARRLVFSTEVVAKNELEARQNASKELNEKVLPYESKRRKTSSADIVAIPEEALVRQID